MSKPVQIYTIVEGPTDVAVIASVLTALDESYTLTTLQPEGDGISGPVRSEHGFGWSYGVRAFCQQEPEAIELSRAQGVVIIHIDADVARKNKADFSRDLERPCPPAKETCDEVRSEILTWLGVEITPDCIAPDGIVLCVPAQALETWVIAALDPAILTSLFNSQLSRESSKGKKRLRALGPEALFECRDDPETLLKQVGLTKTPEAFDKAHARLVAGWANARRLPEAARFEQDLLATLTVLMVLRP